MNEYFVPVGSIQGGDSIFWAAQLMSLIVWGALVYRFYYLPSYYIDNPINNILLFVPIIGSFYNVYLAYSHAGPSPPRSWNFCLNTEVKPKDKKMGIVGYFDYTCYSKHIESITSDNSEFTLRLYYLNYLLFFVILVIQSADYKKSISSDNFPMLINVLGMDCLLVILGSVVPLFAGAPIWSYIALCFLSGITWMSSTLLLIIMANMYKFLITGSPFGYSWKKNCCGARKSNK